MHTQKYSWFNTTNILTKQYIYTFLKSKINFEYEDQNI